MPAYSTHYIFAKELKEEINKYQKNVVRLETELEDLKK